MERIVPQFLHNKRISERSMGDFDYNCRGDRVLSGSRQAIKLLVSNLAANTMVRLSVGSSWATLTEAQRQQVTESFGRYISAIYADRFDSYAGEKLQVTSEQPAAAGVMVRSQIVKANGEPVKVDFMMCRNGDSWLISDIYLDGAISEVATRRSEFAAILKSQGINGLIAALNRKADILTATTAKAS
jgi:phospholipid transport system substrate-binding protein